MKKLYCEIDFLKDFFDKRPILSSENYEEFDIWENYRRFFFDNASITINDIEKYKELVKSNEYFLFLNKRIDGGFINIDFQNKDLENLNNETDPRTIFFLSKSSKCNDLSDDYGLIFISNNNLKNYQEILFKDNKVSIEKNGKIINWNFIENTKHPFNSMIIADNYILKQDQKNNDELRNNFISLLDILLPKNLRKFSFHLTIITGDNRSFIDIKSKYNFLKGEICKLRNYNIKIKIIGKSLDNHDRNIITNYIHIHSGFGFSLFEKGKVLANTILYIDPVFSKKDNEDLTHSLIRQYKKIEKNVQNIGSQTVVCYDDNEPNRLLTSY